VFAWVLCEELLEIGAAGGQDQFMGLERLSLCGESHICELVVLAQLVEHSDQLTIMFVPPKHIFTVIFLGRWALSLLLWTLRPSRNHRGNLLNHLASFYF